MFLMRVFRKNNRRKDLLLGIGFGYGHKQHLPVCVLRMLHYQHFLVSKPSMLDPNYIPHDRNYHNILQLASALSYRAEMLSPLELRNRLEYTMSNRICHGYILYQKDPVKGFDISVLLQSK